MLGLEVAGSNITGSAVGVGVASPLFSGASYTVAESLFLAETEGVGADRFPRPGTTAGKVSLFSSSLH